MSKYFFCLVAFSLFGSLCIFSQKKFGYAVLYLRCGDKDPNGDRVYYSPVIELDRLNFYPYTDGMDTAITPYSVRYFNYAISKWFEIYLRERYRIAVNDVEKYERDATATVYYYQLTVPCNAEKTSPGCFFTNKEELDKLRDAAIQQSKIVAGENGICEVIDVR